MAYDDEYPDYCDNEDEECDTTIDDEPEDEIEATEQETSDAKDRYFDRD